MNRERAKKQVFEAIDNHCMGRVPQTPQGLAIVLNRAIHAIIDAIADELECDADTGLPLAQLQQLSPAARQRLAEQADAIERDMAVATGLPVGYALTRGQAEAIAEVEAEAVRIQRGLNAKADPKGRKGYDY